MEKMETKHSAFLAELLNPNGSHEKGDLFLKKFCERSGLKTLSRVRVSCEKSIETISYGKGRIDIYIEDLTLGCGIIIENKIYAKDLKCQLAKYHEYDSKAQIFYLTLYGGQASKKSLDKLEDSDYIRISYESFVIDWLEECVKSLKCANDCRLRSVLEQYIEHLKMITNQYLSNEEKMKILEKVCSTDDSMLLYFYLMQAKNSVEQEFEKKLAQELEKVCKQKNVKWLRNKVYKKNPLRKIYSGFNFKKGNKILSFEFQEEEYKGFIVGVKKENIRKCTNVHNLEDVFYKSVEKCNCLHSKDWMVYTYWDKYKNWTLDTRKSVLNGDFAADVCQLVENVLLNGVDEDIWKENG